MRKKDLMLDDILRKGHPHKQKTGDAVPCSNCRGYGEVIINTKREYKKMPCPICGGIGEVEV